MTNVHLGNRACVSGPLNGADSYVGVRAKTGIYARSMGEVCLVPDAPAAAAAMKPLNQKTPSPVTPFTSMARHRWVRTWRPPV